MEKLRWSMDVFAREANRSPRSAERSDRRDKSETGQMTTVREVKISLDFRPENGSPSATNVVLLLFFLLLSDFPFPKALSFLNRP